jgi:hypothetical protein
MIMIANATVGFRYFASCGDPATSTYNEPLQTYDYGSCTCEAPSISTYEQYSGPWCVYYAGSLPITSVAVPDSSSTSSSTSVISSRAAFSQYLYYNITVPSSAMLHGLNLMINFTVDPATCPIGLGGTYYMKANCWSWDYSSYCNAQSFGSPDLTIVQADGNYTTVLSFPPTQPRDSSCNCNSAYNSGSSFQVRVDMSDSMEFTCNDVMMTVSYTPYCLNDGRWLDSFCMCSEEWEGI